MDGQLAIAMRDENGAIKRNHDHNYIETVGGLRSSD